MQTTPLHKPARRGLQRRIQQRREARSLVKRLKLHRLMQVSLKAMRQPLVHIRRLMAPSITREKP
jgi:hypothetical protein